MTNMNTDEIVVICDGLFTGKTGKVIGVGSSEHSIKLLVDGVERYEPDYALLQVTEENKLAVELLVMHLTSEAKKQEEAVQIVNGYAKIGNIIYKKIEGDWETITTQEDK